MYVCNIKMGCISEYLIKKFFVYSFNTKEEMRNSTSWGRETVFSEILLPTSFKEIVLINYKIYGNRFILQSMLQG